MSAGDEETFEALVAHEPIRPALSDTRMDVDAALRMLPPPQRAALVVVDMLGFSVADAAAILDISPGTVKSRCARARARLLPYVAHLRAGAPAGDRGAPGGRAPGWPRKGTDPRARASHLRREERRER